MLKGIEDPPLLGSRLGGMMNVTNSPVLHRDRLIQPHNSCQHLIPEAKQQKGSSPPELGAHWLGQVFGVFLLLSALQISADTSGSTREAIGTNLRLKDTSYSHQPKGRPFP